MTSGTVASRQQSSARCCPRVVRQSGKMRPRICATTASHIVSILTTTTHCKTRDRGLPDLGVCERAGGHALLSKLQNQDEQLQVGTWVITGHPHQGRVLGWYPSSLPIQSWLTERRQTHLGLWLSCVRPDFCAPLSFLLDDSVARGVTAYLAPYSPPVCTVADRAQDRSARVTISDTIHAPGQQQVHPSDGRDRSGRGQRQASRGLRVSRSRADEERVLREGPDCLAVCAGRT